MLRRTILSAMLLAAGANSAGAEIVFSGKIKFTAVTSQCRNVRVKDFADSSFHPIVGSNSRVAGLSWVWPGNSRGHGLYGVNFDATFRAVKTGGVGWGDPYLRPTTAESQIRIVSYAPAITAITATTEIVTIRGQIRRPFDDPGGLACIATFIGVYMKDSYQ